METDDMYTMDVDTDYEPTDSAEPVVAARETCQKHSFGITHQLSTNCQSPFWTFKTTEQLAGHRL